MSVTVVTGYVPLPCTHRSREQYEQLGSRLLSLCDNAVAFRCRLKDCWLYQDGMEAGGKDSQAYHVVQHQKSRWLADAANGRERADGVLVWIDYGVMHNPEITETVIRDFLAAVEKSPPDRITSPSGFGDSFNEPVPCWKFLGTVLIVPVWRAESFHTACVLERPAPTTWEVNTWAAVNKQAPDWFSFYEASHDHRLMTGYAR